MLLSFLALLAASVAPVVAQNLAGINITAVPQCAVGCLENNTDKATGCAVSDFSCLCQSTPYINAISCCIQNSCTLADQQTTLKFEIDICNSVNVSIPNFLGCSPLSSTITYNSAATTAKSSSSTPFTSTITRVGAVYSTTTGGPVAAFSGAALLTSSCTTPVIATTPLGSGLTYYFPWIGCASQQVDCCPYHADSAGPLTICPQDYSTISGGCCPTGFTLFSSVIASATPCVGTASVPYVPPASLATDRWIESNKIFAQRYLLATPSTGLSQGTSIGIGVGVAIGCLILLALVLLALRLRRRRREREIHHATMYRSQFANGTEMTHHHSNSLGKAPSYDPSSPGAASAGKATVGELPSPDVDGISSARSTAGTSYTAGAAGGAAYGGSFKGGSMTGGGWSPITPLTPPIPPMELMGSTYMYEHHPAFSGGGGGGEVRDASPQGGREISSRKGSG